MGTKFRYLRNEKIFKLNLEWSIYKLIKIRRNFYGKERSKIEIVKFKILKWIVNEKICQSEL